MAIKAILPVAVLLFLIDWPLIGKSTINIFTIFSLLVILIGKYSRNLNVAIHAYIFLVFILLSGLGLYRYTSILKERNAKK